jgi:hypothetical protein
MTLQLLHSEVPYIWGNFEFSFLSVYNCCLYGAGCDDFDAGKPITRAIGRGGPLKWKLFWALKWEWHLGQKKSRFSGPIPVNGPCNGFAPIKGEGISGTKYIYFARYDSCTKKS